MRTLFSVGLAVLLAGCDPGSTLPETPDHVGTFVLRTVDGVPVPAVVFEEGTRRVELLSGRVSFGADLTAEDEYTYRITDVDVPRTVTTDDEGTYTVSDRKLLVTWGRGATESYALTDSTVTVFDGDLTLMFHR